MSDVTMGPWMGITALTASALVLLITPSFSAIRFIKRDFPIPGCSEDTTRTQELRAIHIVNAGCFEHNNNILTFHDQQYKLFGEYLEWKLHNPRNELLNNSDTFYHYALVGLISYTEVILTQCYVIYLLLLCCTQ